MQPNPVALQEKHRFDGQWWSKTSSEEHSGFINGAADCLTWVLHDKGFNGTPEQLEDKIGKFYKEHSDLANLSVIDVWKLLWEKMSPSADVPQSGEIWKNAHWYLDGFWWLDDTPDQKLGYVEGYLWCIETRVSAPMEKYSKPASFYVEKIDAFTKANANTKADREKVALILRRYKDPATSVHHE